MRFGRLLPTLVSSAHIITLAMASLALQGQPIAPKVIILSMVRTLLVPCYPSAAPTVPKSQHTSVSGPPKPKCGISDSQAPVWET